MTTLAAYCQSMGWDLNDPAVRSKVRQAVGNIGDNTELQEYQMDALQDALHSAMGALQPGDDPMLDAFNGRQKANGDLQFKSHQDMSDYLNATVPQTNSPTRIRNDLAKRWKKAEGFSGSAIVVMDAIANIGAYMPWNWN